MDLSLLANILYESSLKNALDQQAETKLAISKLKSLISPGNSKASKLSIKAHFCELLICNALIARKPTHELDRLLDEYRKARWEFVNYGRSEGIPDLELQICIKNTANKLYDYERDIETLGS